MRKLIVLVFAVVGLAVPAAASAGADAWADPGGGGLPECNASREGVTATFLNAGGSVSWICHNGTWRYLG